MSSMPLVTIILTTFNSERYVAHSIKSCLAQTHADIELLIVDGGSRDGTLDIVADYQQRDVRIRVIHQQNNAGKLPGAINLGLENAQGDYITWTQDDCWYEPHAIQTMVVYLEAHPEVALVYTDYWDVDESGSRIRYQQAGLPEQVFISDVIRVSFLLRREVYETIGPQEPRFFPVHEVPWRATVGKHFKIEPLHIPLMSYTVHSESLTGRIGRWDVARLSAQALLETGGINRNTYRTRLASLEIDQAYTHFVFEGAYKAFRKRFVAGLRLNARWLTNVGLWKLYFISLTPFREKHRVRLHREWQRRMKSEQAALILQPEKQRG